MGNGLMAGIARMMGARGSRRNQIGREPEQDSVQRILEAAPKVMSKASYCTFVTSGPDGPTARIVYAFPPTADLAIHISTSPTSAKYRQAAAAGNAVVVFQAAGSGGLTAYCRTAIIEDPSERRRWWKWWSSMFWPHGPDSPEFGVIRCEPYALEMWAPKHGVCPSPYGLRGARLELGTDGWRLGP